MDQGIIEKQKDSFWSTKPYWCQPWSILCTGIISILLSWLIFHILLITISITLLVFAWWVLFLYFVPNLYESSQTKSSNNDL